MIDQIYCPECDGIEHKRIYVQIKRKISFTDAIINGIVSVLFGLVIMLLFHHGRNQDVLEPVCYQCQRCGKRFMSPETYQEEIRDARRNIRNGIIIALPNAVMLVLTAIVFIEALSKSLSSVEYAIILFGVLFLVLTVCAISTVIKSAKSIMQLTADWNALQEAQVKHTRTSPLATGEHIPAWKRVQLEQNK